MVRNTLIVVVITLLCAPAGASEPDLQRLAGFMTGSFSSAAQAAENEAFFHITLHMVPIWPDRTDGVWLYVEQAAASSPDAPYRQRVYHVRHVGEDLYASSVYTFPDPLTHAGAWQAEAPLAGLDRADLELRDGCTIYLRPRPDGQFAGSTLGRLCTSELRGATWASSEVVIGPDGMVSWDRGWNDAGDQVWGAVEAGYRFDRLPDADQE